MSRAQKRIVLLGLDLVIAPLSLVICYGLLYDSFTPRFSSGLFGPECLILGCGAVLTSSILGINRIKLKAFESRAILKTAGFSAIMGLWHVDTIGFLGLDSPFAASVLFAILYFLAAVGSRYAILQALIWTYNHGRKRYRVLIYGAGTTGVQLAVALKTHETIVPVAFIDDNPALQSLSIAGLPVHSSQQIRDIATARNIDRILLAMPSVSAPKQARIARRLQRLGLDVHALPSFSQLVGEEAAIVDRLAPVKPGYFLGRTNLDESIPDGCAAYAGRNILVTGAGGSIGAELCRQLMACKPERLVLFDVSEISLYKLEREMIALGATGPVEIVPVLGSVTDSRLVRAVVQSNAIDVIFHAAAYKHVPLVEANPIAGLYNNVIGTRVVADAAQDGGVSSFILISSDKAVRPTNVMGASKRFAEFVVQDMARRSRGTAFSIVRFGNVLGSSGSVIPLFHEQIANGGPVTLTHDDVSRYFMTMSEAVRLVLLAGSYARSTGATCGDVFVLDMGKPVRIRDLARQMIEAAGYTVRDAQNPDGDIEIVTTGLRPGEKLTEELLIGEGLLTTPHPKIMRAMEAGLSEIDFAGALRSLQAAIAASDPQAARDVIARWVEGFDQVRIKKVG